MMRVKPVALVVLAGLVWACSTHPRPPRNADSMPAVDYATDEVLRLAGITDADKRPYYREGSSYDAAITAPETILGHPLGARPAAPDRVVACFRRWAEESPRVQVGRYAVSYEGRELVRAIISTPDNLRRLDQIQADIGRLADPRQLAAGAANRIIRESPAIAWFGYSIHGNELTGSDAAVAFGYHLIAGSDEVVGTLLRDVVVIVDPVMNPDGRQRTLNAIEEMRSRVGSENYAGMERFRWPGGRGNHYLFDLNRDWIIGVHPETRGRWEQFFQFHPQLIVDAHEMGALDTYLFSPKNKPLHPSFPAEQQRWYNIFARDLAAAFDRRGWAYYTREWSDGWFPGYTSTWGPINGAIGFLYEQSSTRGLPLRRPSGQRVTYSESMQGHAVSSLVNLATLARNREAVLRDYLRARRAVADRGNRAFAIKPGLAPERERDLVQILQRQQIEVYQTTAPFTARDVRTALARTPDSVRMPAGTYLVFEAQPQGGLVRALLEFDSRRDDESLAKEREHLERTGTTRIYDVTAWSLGHAFALDAYWIAAPRVDMRPVAGVGDKPADKAAAVPGDTPDDKPAASAPATQPAQQSASPYAWIVDGRTDSATVFAAHAMELGLNVHVADEDFATAEGDFSRGSVLIRHSENPPNTAELVAKAAASARVAVVPTQTGRAPGDGADLGGRHFDRLERPRVALLANSPIRSNAFGHVWHHLDQRLQIPVSILDLQSLSQRDLRRYNVIILPEVVGSGAGIVDQHKRALEDWMRNGGTLIAIGQSAAALTKEDLKLSAVRLRRDVLDALPVYRAAAQRSIASRAIELDKRAIWDGVDKVAASRSADGDGRSAGNSGKDSKGASKKGAGGDAAKEMAKQRDAWERRFSPRGVMLRGLVDQASWITAGLPEEMPVLFGGDRVFLAVQPARVAVRLAAGQDLRLSGLLWPEARHRIGHSAYLTSERFGRGQMILFAFDPVFRGLTRGTARLLSNAVIYGPGLGASQPNIWQQRD